MHRACTGRAQVEGCGSGRSGEVSERRESDVPARRAPKAQGERRRTGGLALWLALCFAVSGEGRGGNKSSSGDVAAPPDGPALALRL